VDLGIRGRAAIVCGSSRGLGRACAEALAREGVDVVINGRTAEAVQATAAQLSDAYGVSATPVVADVDTVDGRAALLAACPSPDLLVTNNAGPRPADFASTDLDAWRAALESNMLAPILLVQAVIDGMRARRFGRIVNITSAMVKSPNPLMTLSVGARTGLTGVAKALSRDVVRDNVTINNLLPERFDTDRQRYMAELVMQIGGITWDEARAQQVASIAAGRLGEPSELGDLFVVEQSRPVVDHAEGAGLGAVGEREWRAGVEADPRVVGDEWVVGEALVGQGVGHLHDSFAQDRMGAQRRVARRLRRGDPDLRLEPLTVGVDEGHECDGHVERRARQLCEAVEPWLG
jgi:3-oxoacyl-[acyl-carrier protein] reductase